MSRSRWLGPLLAAGISAVLVAGWRGPAWVLMWLIAFAIYAGCKWITAGEPLPQGMGVPPTTRLIYLLLWPGMSLEEFVGTPAPPKRLGRVPRWLPSTAKTLAGAGLVWIAVPLIPADAGLARGWVGMIGIILMLHFGTFHLLALLLQASGLNARANMRSPLLARSLADFWGNRWNTAFSVLADRYGFRPLAPHIGPRAALVVVFLASGLLHEAVITLPARGGYGLPTAYFALQAVGLFIERTPWIRRRPWLRRFSCWSVLIVPLGCLFPPVFVHNVILPMLHALALTGS